VPGEIISMDEIRAGYTGVPARRDRRNRARRFLRWWRAVYRGHDCL